MQSDLATLTAAVASLANRDVGGQKKIRQTTVQNNLVVVGGDVTPEVPAPSKPKLADFTWVNQGTATAIDSTTGLLMSAPQTPLTSANLRVLVKAAPPTPYHLTVKYVPNGISQNFLGGGLVWRNSSSGKLIFLDFQSHDDKYEQVIKYYNNASSFNSFTAARNIMDPGAGFWIRIQDSGSMRTAYTSRDGENFTSLGYSEASSDFMSADQVGFCIDSQNDDSQSMEATFTSFEVGIP